MGLMSETECFFEPDIGCPTVLSAITEFLDVVKDGRVELCGVAPPRGLLISGPRFLGKSCAAKRALAKAGVHFTELNALNLDSSVFGEQEGTIRRAFKDAAEGDGPFGVVFIDDVDRVCPKRESTSDPTRNRVTANLLSLMDDGTGTRFADRHVLVVATATFSNEVDVALRRPGRFDQEVNVLPLNCSERRRIFKHVFRSLKETSRIDRWAELVASKTPGLNLSEIVTLAQRLRNSQNEHHLLSSVAEVRARAAQGPFRTETSPISWNHIAGMSSAKKRLQMALEWPSRYSTTWKTLGLESPQGFLLHGPPGCGKTSLVRAAASSSSITFLSISGAELYSCYLGEAESFLREAFQTARLHQPSLLFIDEVDAIVGRRPGGSDRAGGDRVRERILSTLLTEMDGMNGAKGVLIVGATNRVDMLDSALLRPGRFDEIIEIQEPSKEDLLEVLKIHASDIPMARSVNFEDLLNMGGFSSPADIAAFCSEAVSNYLEECASSPTDQSDATPVVTSEHFERAARAFLRKTSSGRYCSSTRGVDVFAGS